MEHGHFRGAKIIYFGGTESPLASVGICTHPTKPNCDLIGWGASQLFVQETNRRLGFGIRTLEYALYYIFAVRGTQSACIEVAPDNGAMQGLVLKALSGGEYKFTVIESTKDRDGENTPVIYTVTKPNLTNQGDT